VFALDEFRGSRFGFCDIGNGGLDGPGSLVDEVLLRADCFFEVCDADFDHVEELGVAFDIGAARRRVDGTAMGISIKSKALGEADIPFCQNLV
jgi:hypothetical protein